MTFKKGKNETTNENDKKMILVSPRKSQFFFCP